MKVFIAAILGVVAALHAAPTAHADQWSYLMELNNAGVYYDSIAGALADGRTVCSSLRNGAPVSAVLGSVTSVGYNLTEAAVLVQAAATNMCADQLPVLQALRTEDP